jgi:hypothetical protein
MLLRILDITGAETDEALPRAPEIALSVARDEAALVGEVGGDVESNDAFDAVYVSYVDVMDLVEEVMD